MATRQTDLDPIPVTPKTGHEPFSLAGQPLPVTLQDFWRWSASDLIGNTARGILTEYIVASALDVAHDVRREWDAYDIKTKDGIAIEVKSASYVQGWQQRGLSQISFGIAPRRAWSAETNEIIATPRRHADVYVFAVLAHQEQATLDPLNLDQWEFYVLPTAVLNARMPTQKTITLASLRQLEPTIAAYDQLRQAVETASSGIRAGKRPT